MIQILRYWFQLVILTPIRTLFYSPGKLFSSGRKVFGISLPARVAWLMALFLVVCVVISLFAYARRQHSPPVNVLLNNKNYAVVVTVLVILIPIVVYHVLRMWLEGNVSPFEDIDRAWKAGLAELDRQGFDLSQIPMFMIIGSAGEMQEKAIFDASRMSLSLREIPQGPAALHWYANPDAVFLALTNVGCLSRLATLGKQAPEETRSRPEPASAPSSGASLRGTIIAGGDESPAERPPAPLRESGEMVAPSVGRAPDIRGTMMASSAAGPSERADAGAAGPGAEMRPITLPSGEASEQEQRLQYLCQLIRRARQPTCPINGIISLLSFGLIQRGPREGRELQQTLKRDLQTIHRVFQIRCPVTAVVAGMEEESGFRELVRRVGRDRAGAQRFGKGFSLSNPPIPERLEALCAHACGSFEDWVYTLFREKGSLSKPGNTKLYSLLCKIRHDVQTRLGNILVAGCSSDPDQDANAEPLYFGGCYFAATGDTEDRQAFVKGVFDKLPDEQAELQWTREARLEDQRYQTVASAIFFVNFLLLAGIVGMLVYHYLIR